MNLHLYSQISYTTIFLFICLSLSAQNKKLYMIPGQGSDTRLFQYLQIEGYDTIGINYIIPGKKENMNAFAKRMAAEIDTTENFAILGVSLGGMLAMEMTSFLNPEKIILISSAKNETEIPGKYKLFRKIPINKIIGGRFLKFCTVLLQPVYEPLSKEDQKLWRSMMKEKNPTFMRRAVDCIVNWKGYDYADLEVLHIHGAKDRTLPIKHVGEHHCIEEGTHIMTLTEADKVSAVINSFLND